MHCYFVHCFFTANMWILHVLNLSSVINCYFFLIKCWHTRIYSRTEHFGGYGAAWLSYFLWFSVRTTLACTVLQFSSDCFFSLSHSFCLNDNLFIISGVLWSSYMGLMSTGSVASLNLNFIFIFKCSSRLQFLDYLIQGIIWELVPW